MQDVIHHQPDAVDSFPHGLLACETGRVNVAEIGTWQGLGSLQVNKEVRQTSETSIRGPASCLIMKTRDSSV